MELHFITCNKNESCEASLLDNSNLFVGMDNGTTVIKRPKSFRYETQLEANPFECVSDVCVKANVVAMRVRNCLIKVQNAWKVL